MSDKKISIGLQIDSKEFDASVNAMRQKLSQIYAPLDVANRQNQTGSRLENMGVQNNMSKTTMEAFQKATQQAKRDLDQLISTQVKDQEKLARFIGERETKVKNLRDMQLQTVGDKDKELKLTREIAGIEENIARQRQTYRQKDTNLNQLLNAKQNMKDSEIKEVMSRWANSNIGGSGGGDVPPTGVPKTGGGLPGGITTAGILGAATAATKVAEYMIGNNLRIQQAKGSAISSTLGSDISSMYSGNAPEMSFFGKERESASGEAQTKRDKQEFIDFGRAAISGIAIVAGGALTATGVGAAIGIPMMGAGIASIGMSDKMRAIYSGDESGYNQLASAKQAEDRKSAFDAYLAQDPKRTESFKYFQQNKDRDLQTQRQLGLSDTGLRGGSGFLAGGANLGFSDTQMMGMSSSILGAGGSTKMARSNSGFGLELERGGFNGAGMLGSLSNSMSAAASKDAAIEIISKGTTIGLNNTEFAAENKKFTEAASAIVSRSGTESRDDASRLASLFGDFVGQKSMRGVEAGQTAFEQFQERSGQTGGREGVLRFKALQGDKDLSKLTGMHQSQLLGMESQYITEDSPAIAAFAKEAGISTKELVSRMTSKGGISGPMGPGTMTFPGQREDVEKGQAAWEKFKSEKGYTEEQAREAVSKNAPGSEEGLIAQGQMGIGLAGNRQDKNALSKSALLANTGEVTGYGTNPKDIGKTIVDNLTKDTGRIGDKYNQEAAQAADAARKNINEMTDAMWKAVEGTRPLTDNLRQLSDVASKASSANLQNQKQGDITNANIIGPALGGWNMVSGAQSPATVIPPQK